MCAYACIYAGHNWIWLQLGNSGRQRIRHLRGARPEYGETHSSFSGDDRALGEHISGSSEVSVWVLCILGFAVSKMLTPPLVHQQRLRTQDGRISSGGQSGHVRHRQGGCGIFSGLGHQRMRGRTDPNGARARGTESVRSARRPYPRPRVPYLHDILARRHISARAEAQHMRSWRVCARKHGRRGVLAWSHAGNCSHFFLLNALSDSFDINIFILLQQNHNHSLVCMLLYRMGTRSAYGVCSIY